MHGWSRCEGLYEVHFIPVHCGQTHFSTSWRAKTSFASMALATKLNELGHYETIFTLGTCIGNVVHVIFLHDLIIMCGCVGMLELHFKNPQWVFSHTN